MKSLGKRQKKNGSRVRIQARGRWWALCFVPVALRCSVVCSAGSVGECSVAGGSGGPLAIMPAISVSCDPAATAASALMQCSCP